MTEERRYRVTSPTISIGYGAAVYHVYDGVVSLPSAPWVAELEAQQAIVPLVEAPQSDSPAFEAPPAREKARKARED